MAVEAAALHGEQTSVQPNPRPVSIEDNILHQIDRIGYLRSVGEDWKEPVFHLRDLLVGLEDEEFWDGVPKHLRASIDAMPANVLQAYRRRGWNTMPARMKVVRNKDGHIVDTFLDPTPGELSAMLRTIMALLARSNMTWRRRNVDEIPIALNGHDKGAEIQEAARLVA